MSDEKDAVWKFKLPNRRKTIAAAIKAIPDDWRDATGSFIAPIVPAVVGKAVLRGVKVAINHKGYKVDLRLDFPISQLAQSIFGVGYPSEIILEEPTWTDATGVPLALAKELALDLFHRNFRGCVAFQSPRCNTDQGFRFHLETCEFYFGNEGGIVTVKVNRHWGGETKNVQPLIEALKHLKLEVLSQPE